MKGITRLKVLGLIGVAILFGWSLFLSADRPNDVFEVDGNSVVDTQDDWNLLNGTNGTNGVAGASLVRTFAASDNVGFIGGGSKDELDIPNNWLWTVGSQPDKDLLTNGYAAAYRNLNGHLIVVFGAERFSTVGDSNIGIWFFQNNVGPLEDGTFSGSHKNNDVFITSAFSNGGKQPTISVYTWDTSCTKPDHKPSAGECGGDNLRLRFDSVASPTSCSLVDEACALTNLSSPVTVSWPYASKFGGDPNTVPTEGFFEGGVDLTQIFNLGNVPCISTFLMETRSSQSTDAVLKDFLGGGFSLCALSATKSCTDAQGEGGTISFSGDVTNTGAVDLTDLSITDSIPADATDPSQITWTPSGTTLQAGATVHYSGTYKPAASDSTDTITATAKAGSDTITATASATCDITTHPAIEVTKSCADATGPGQAITFEGDITNAGDTTLKNVSISDYPAATIDALSTTTLAPGAKVHYTGNYIPEQTGGEKVDTVTATGEDAVNGGTVTKTATATCRIQTHPAVTVTKLCANADGPGAPITFSGRITNSGDVTLNDLSITDDPVATIAALSTTTLAPGAFVEYTGSYVPTQSAGDKTDTVTASGVDALNGGTASAQASATCHIITAPSIAVTKTCENALGLGASINFSGTITNTGNVGLSGITLFDAVGGSSTAVTLPQTTLTPGQSMNYNGSYTPSTSPSTDTVTATGTDAVFGGSATAHASATCIIAIPTRTLGFWATHTAFTNSVWQPQTLCTANPITATAAPGQNQLLGGFLADVAKKSGGAQRPPLDKARMVLLQQYFAAVLNHIYFGSGSNAMLTAALTAYCGNDKNAMAIQTGILDTFNQAGDGYGTTLGAGSATPADSAIQANIPFWDVTLR